MVSWFRNKVQDPTLTNITQWTRPTATIGRRERERRGEGEEGEGEEGKTWEGTKVDDEEGQERTICCTYFFFLFFSFLFFFYVFSVGNWTVTAQFITPEVRSDPNKLLTATKAFTI